MRAAGCPDPCLYEQLMSGDYPGDDEVAHLTDHLEACPACTDTVKGLRHSDTFAGLLAGADGAARLSDSTAQRLAERLDRLTHTDAHIGPTPPPLPVTSLGPYRVVRDLGRGGMGVVLLADDPASRRQVALKVMRPELAHDPDARRRFTHEARAMAAIEHDHVVAVHHVGEEGGVPSLVMPLLRGETLEACLQRAGKLPPAETIRIVRQMVDGLAAAHGRGLIHRDMKPANVWLEEGSGRVKVLDFGLARATEAASGPSGPLLAGTPSYMAPEQARGEAVGEAADVWVLGVIVYQCLTGEVPFGHGLSALHKIQTSQTPPLPAGCESLAEVCGRCLEKEPARRPTVSELAELLKAAGEAAKQPPSATILGSRERPPTGEREPARIARRPRRWLVGAVGAVAMAVLVGAVVYFLSPPRQAGQPTQPESPQPKQPQLQLSLRFTSFEVTQFRDQGLDMAELGLVGEHKFEARYGDRSARYPREKPTTPADFAATLYWALGIDPRAEANDLLGRPHVLTDGKPVTELFA